MNKEIFEVQYINLIGNVLIRYKHSRLPLVLYRFDRPKNDDYSVFNSIKNLKKSHIYFLIGMCFLKVEIMTMNLLWDHSLHFMMLIFQI